MQINEIVKDTMNDPFPTFFAVEEPFVVRDAIPRDLRNASNGKTITNVGPSKSNFQIFESFALAQAYAQRMNKPLVILEISAAARVIPQLPLVERLAAKDAA